MALMVGESNMKKKTGRIYIKFALEIVEIIWFKSTKRDHIYMRTKPIRVFPRIFIISMVDTILSTIYYIIRV